MIVVGVGNSGVQIAADRACDADLAWVMLREPSYLADDVDGRALFAEATARRRALDEGRTDTGGVASLGDIVAIPPVRAAGLLKAQPTFDRITPTGVVRVDGAIAGGGRDHLVYRSPPRPFSSRPTRPARPPRPHPYGRRPGTRRASSPFSRLRRLDRPRLRHPHRRRPACPRGGPRHRGGVALTFRRLPEKAIRRPGCGGRLVLTYRPPISDSVIDICVAEE